MSAWTTKSLAWVLIVCYLSVSSVGAAHALPMLLGELSVNAQLDSAQLDTANTAMDLIIGLDIGLDGLDNDLAPNCHSAANDLDEKASGACKIVCATMASALSSQSGLVLRATCPNQRIAFFVQDITPPDSSLELQPPK